MRIEHGFVAALRNQWQPTVGFRQRAGQVDLEQYVAALVNVKPAIHACEPVSTNELQTVDDVALDEINHAFELVEQGHVAFVVLAGGIGSRTGGSKSFIRLPGVGVSLVTHKIFQATVSVNDRATTALTWIMVAPNTLERYASELSTLSPQPTCSLFEQFDAPVLRPDYSLHVSDDGKVIRHPTGTGDLGAALIESGVLTDNPQVKHLYVVPVSNVLADIDLRVLARHIRQGSQLTCEVIPTEKNQRLDDLLYWADGRQTFVTLDDVPPNSEPAHFGSNGCMVIDVATLVRSVDLPYTRKRELRQHQVTMKIERSLSSLTSCVPATYVCVEPERCLNVLTQDDVVRADKLLDGNAALGLHRMR